MRLLGWMVAPIGAALAIYAIPPGSYVGLAALLVGVGLTVTGVRMAVRTHAT